MPARAESFDPRMDSPLSFLGEPFMKSYWLPLVIVVFALGTVRAEDSTKKEDSPKKESSSSEAVSAAEQYKNNPDDTKAFTAWLNETFTEISELMNSAPDEAEKKLAAAKEFVSSLKPESAAGKSNLTRVKLIATNFEETIALSRVTLAELEKQVDEKPDDLAVLRKYSRKVSTEIGTIARSEPEKAEALMNAAKERVEKLKAATTDKAATTALEQLERALTSYVRTIEHGKQLIALIGQKSPAIDVQDWANGSPLAADELKGKVVLLDFWAVWCGPCIATFPHLREWQDKYSDKGLVIIGMTKYYNYAWDEAAGKAVKGKEKDEVSHEDEQKMLKHFADLHRLSHRFAIQTETHSLADDFAVQGIPQAVVIDRQGVIRLIRVGSGSKNAKDIGELIEKLVADKPVAAK